MNRHLEDLPAGDGFVMETGTIRNLRPRRRTPSPGTPADLAINVNLTSMPWFGVGR
ncbi:MAG TPA: hypothetical protein VLE22_20515 [Bryobacteraceae bacterium]|nr:hypothetical protein [Bryobacteraceae bacterium]